MNSNMATIATVHVGQPWIEAENGAGAIAERKQKLNRMTPLW